MEYTIGCIALLPYSFVPMDWLLCDGSLVPIATYQVLFSVIGTRYGGDGINNFKLPDLRSANPSEFINHFIAYNGIYPERN